ncbi:hypothetical protein BDV3_003235 [Batrachochytrium dendrobatidis]
MRYCTLLSAAAVLLGLFNDSQYIVCAETDVTDQTSTKTDVTVQTSTETDTLSNDFDIESNSFQQDAGPPDNSPYSMGVTQSWYLPMKASLDTEFLGFENSDLVVLSSHNSFAHLNKTSSGFQQNITLNAGETFRCLALDLSTLVTLSGDLGEYVGVWDAKTGAAYARTEITDLDELVDAKESYDVAFLVDNEVQVVSFATLCGGRQITYLTSIGTIVWSFKPEDSAVRFQRLVTGKDSFLVVGTRDDSSIILINLELVTGEKLSEKTIDIKSPLANPSDRSKFAIMGDPEFRWIVWIDQDDRVQLYSVVDEIQLGIPESVYEYTNGKPILGLVELGSYSTYMFDIVVQFSEGIDIIVGIEYDTEIPTSSVVYFPQTSSRPIIFKQRYEENHYVMSRLHVDIYNQMLLEFNYIDSGNTAESKVLFPAFKGTIVKGYMFYDFNEKNEILWNVVGLDHNGMYVSYDNTQVFKTTYSDSDTELDTDSTVEQGSSLEDKKLDQIFKKLEAIKEKQGNVPMDVLIEEFSKLSTDDKDKDSKSSTFQSESIADKSGVDSTDTDEKSKPDDPEIDHSEL